MRRLGLAWSLGRTLLPPPSTCLPYSQGWTRQVDTALRQHRRTLISIQISVTPRMCLRLITLRVSIRLDRCQLQFGDRSVLPSVGAPLNFFPSLSLSLRFPLRSSLCPSICLSVPRVARYSFSVSFQSMHACLYLPLLFFRTLDFYSSLFQSFPRFLALLLTRALRVR